jgi:hypothetical protein
MLRWQEWQGVAQVVALLLLVGIILTAIIACVATEM